MKKITRKLILAAFLVASFTAAPIVDSVAQTSNQNQQRKSTTTQQRTGNQQTSQNKSAHDKEQLTDAEFVRKVSAGNLAEIELSRLALERASSSEVKQFAQHMVEQHTKANQELQSTLARASRQNGQMMGTGAGTGTGTGMGTDTDMRDRSGNDMQGQGQMQQGQRQQGDMNQNRTGSGVPETHAGDAASTEQRDDTGYGTPLPGEGSGTLGSNTGEPAGTRDQQGQQRDRATSQTGNQNTQVTTPRSTTDNNLDDQQRMRDGHGNLQGANRDGRMPQDGQQGQMRQGDATGAGAGARTGMGGAEALSTNLIATELRAEDRATYNRLQRLRGAEFDRAYMDEMLKDHDKTVMLFEKQAKNGQNPELRNFAQENLDMIKEHKEMAKKAHPDKSKRNK